MGLPLKFGGPAGGQKRTRGNSHSNGGSAEDGRRGKKTSKEEKKCKVEKGTRADFYDTRRASEDGPKGGGSGSGEEAWIKKGAHFIANPNWRPPKEEGTEIKKEKKEEEGKAREERERQETEQQAQEERERQEREQQARKKRVKKERQRKERQAREKEEQVREEREQPAMEEREWQVREESEWQEERELLEREEREWQESLKREQQAREESSLEEREEAKMDDLIERAMKLHRSSSPETKAKFIRDIKEQIPKHDEDRKKRRRRGPDLISVTLKEPVRVVRWGGRQPRRRNGVMWRWGPKTSLIPGQPVMSGQRGKLSKYQKGYK